MCWPQQSRASHLRYVVIFALTYICLVEATASRRRAIAPRGSVPVDKEGKAEIFTEDFALTFGVKQTLRPEDRDNLAEKEVGLAAAPRTARSRRNRVRRGAARYRRYSPVCRRSCRGGAERRCDPPQRERVRADFVEDALQSDFADLIQHFAFLILLLGRFVRMALATR
jgi:hypothetical protein